MVASTQQQLRGVLLRLKHMGLPREALATAARVGWTARGVLYFILGALAALAAVGEGGGLHDGKGVVRWIMSLPAGTLLVGLAAAGFAGYALYCAALLIFGADNTDGAMAGVLARLKGGVGCIVYGSMTLTSVQLLLGHHEHGDSKRVWIAALLVHTWGRVLLGLIGVGLIGFSVFQCVYAANAKHRDEVNDNAMSATETRAFVWIGRIGLVARGVVFGVIGYFAVRAALAAAPSGASASTAGALREIRQFGWVPLVIVAVGLSAYGVLQLFYAKYRRVEVA